MTAREIASLVSSFGFPYAYYQFPDGTAEEPPFVCFYLSGSDDLIADNYNYSKIRSLTIELYTDNKDYSAEATIEAALTNAKIPYQTTETYIDSERLYMVTYNAEILFNGGE